jgi:hypothetical protein
MQSLVQQEDLLKALKLGMRTESAAFQDYSAYMKQHYYLLDEQKFTAIHCKVHMRALNDTLSTVRRQLEKVPGKFAVTGDLDSFALDLQNGKSLSFQRPHFDVVSNDTSAIVSQDSFDKGRQQVIAGLDAQVSAAIEVLGGLFEEYTLSTKKIVKTFSKTRNGAEATAEDKGMVYKTTYADLKRTAGFTDKSVTGRETAVFTRLGGKLAVSRADTHVTRGDNTLDFHLRVTYGQAGKIPFPKTVSKERTLENNGARQTAWMEISLESCTAE